MAESADQLAKEIVGKPGASGGSGGKFTLIVWGVLAVATVVVFGSSGYLVGSVFKPTAKAASTQPSSAPAEDLAKEPAKATADSDYFEFEPFTATLETPRRDRFLVVTIILSYKRADKTIVTDALEKKKHELRSKITLYLNSCTLEEVTGSKNLNRILREVQDMSNECLWPSQRPMINQALFKNFAIQ